MAYLRKSIFRISNKFLKKKDINCFNVRSLSCRTIEDNVLINMRTFALTKTQSHFYSVQSTKGSDEKISNISNLGLADKLLSEKVTPGKEEETEQQKEQRKDQENKVRAIKFSGYFVAGMVIIGGTIFIICYGTPLLDENGKEIKDAYSNMVLPKQYILRAVNEAKVFNKMIQEPARDQLLPDPLKEPYIQPPYTLVVELKDILVHPEWTYQNGWRFRKRPGVDFLLQHCAPPLFEIVIYTSEQGFTVYPVIDQLDPNGFIWYRLFKDSTRYVDGKHLKDLNCLNRDLKKVIIIDWDKDAVTAPRNQLTLKRWEGNMDDQTLAELALMLRTIAESEIDDVREVLDYYRTFDDPIFAFRENQRTAQEQEMETQKKLQEAKKQSSFISSITKTITKRIS